MNFRKTYLYILAGAICTLVVGCTVKYSFSGASIPEGAKTFTVAYFPNNAQMVTPTLSQVFTDALIDRMERQTRLVQVNDGGDLSFEGEITRYETRPSSISGDEHATQNRLTITVRVQYTNAIEPQNNFNQSFSAYSDYPTTTPLQDAEGTLIPEIVEDLVNQIFNAALAKW